MSVQAEIILQNGADVRREQCLSIQSPPPQSAVDENKQQLIIWNGGGAGMP